MTGRKAVARYAGVCATRGCRASIQPGDAIVIDEQRKTRHESCAARAGVDVGVGAPTMMRGRPQDDWTSRRRDLD